VKLGILTDGLVFQLYSDTGAENMMDDDPFVVVDLSEVAQDRISDNGLDALLKLRKGTFDPADVGADAKRKIYVAAYVDALDRAFQQPNEAMVRTVMDLAGTEGRRTSKLVEEHAPIVADAIQAFFDKKLLERVGFASRQDLVRVPPAILATSPVPIETGTEPVPEPAAAVADSGIVTTDTERAVFDYVRRRLSFLIGRDEEMFKKLDHLFPVDYKTVFAVCYKQERKGKLFNFREGTSPQYRFEFLTTGENIQTDSLADIDDQLLAAFKKRVQELG
jgi:hypothetical protein